MLVLLFVGLYLWEMSLTWIKVVFKFKCFIFTDMSTLYFAIRYFNLTKMSSFARYEVGIFPQPLIRLRCLQIKCFLSHRSTLDRNSVCSLPQVRYWGLLTQFAVHSLSRLKWQISQKKKTQVSVCAGSPLYASKSWDEDSGNDWWVFNFKVSHFQIILLI